MPSGSHNNYHFPNMFNYTLNTLELTKNVMCVADHG